MRLDEGSAGSHWAINPDGVIGRALLTPAPATVTIPLGLSSEVSFTGRVMLLPHDWRDGRGAVRASVAVTDPDGRSHELWSGALRCARQRGAPRGRAIDCRLPAWSTALTLRLYPGPHQHRAIARAIWLEPMLTDPHAPSPVARPDAPGGSDPPAEPSSAPLISVLTPVHDPPPHMLAEAIASVQAQTFPSWELCLVDDGSSDPEIIAALQSHAATDPRIHLTRHEHARGISEATNAAMNMATGRYIALLDHDDTLTPDALQHVADQIHTQPDLDMIYSDEDVVAGDTLVERHPKPGWSPEHMATLMYTCHLGVYRRALAVQLGGFRSEFDGCQDYDFVLRLVERTDRVAHIPRILYHWRAHASSTAGGDQAKPYAYLAQPGAIADHLQRSDIDARVQFGQFPGLHRVIHRVAEQTSVDLVLAVADERGLTQAAVSWLQQPHPTWNFVIAAPAHTLPAVVDALTSAGIPHARITTIASEHPPTQALAHAAHAARSEHLLLMQTPALGLTHDWLTRLIGYSHQPHIAAAGPIVLAPDGRIQHAGIAIPTGTPLYLLHGARSSMDNFFGYGTAVYNVSALSGVLITRRELYEHLGGLDPDYGELAPIDYCLRALAQHHRLVIVPDARLRTTGPDITTNDLPTLQRLHTTWAQHHTHDPYYNAHYRTDHGDYSLLPAG